MRTNPVTSKPKKYKPIDCDVHDVLEEYSVLSRPAAIRYRNSEGIEQQIFGHIDNVYVKDGAEFLKLTGGEVIRLDQIIDVRDGRHH